MVLENPVELAVQENPGVPGVLVVPVVQVALENPAVLIVQVEAVPVQNHRLAHLAVALRTKSVIAAHHRDPVPLLAVEEDLAAAVAEIMREPAAAEAATAWAVADTAAVVAVAEVAAVAEEDAAAVAGSRRRRWRTTKIKRTVDEEKTNEIKNKYYDFVENFRDRLRDR